MVMFHVKHLDNQDRTDYIKEAKTVDMSAAYKPGSSPLQGSRAFLHPVQNRPRYTDPEPIATQTAAVELPGTKTTMIPKHPR